MLVQIMISFSRAFSRHAVPLCLQHDYQEDVCVDYDFMLKCILKTCCFVLFEGFTINKILV